MAPPTKTSPPPDGRHRGEAGDAPASPRAEWAGDRAGQRLAALAGCCWAMRRTWCIAAAARPEPRPAVTWPRARPNRSRPANLAAVGRVKLLRRYVRGVLPTWAIDRVTDGLLQLFSHRGPPVRELRNRGLESRQTASPITQLAHRPPLDLLKDCAHAASPPWPALRWPPRRGGAILRNHRERLPTFRRSTGRQTPIRGLYGARQRQRDLLYRRATGNYIVDGQLIDTHARQPPQVERVDKLTAIVRQAARSGRHRLEAGNGRAQDGRVRRPELRLPAGRFERDLQRGEERHRLYLPLPHPRPDLIEKRRTSGARRTAARAGARMLRRRAAGQGHGPSAT